ncbi:MAG TPA: glycosyltransferase family 39 protein [Spirochaetia bacterium]|nr:glycosyltransferase family 39 protein [Spirochaetia bacterium]
MRTNKQTILFVLILLLSIFLRLFRLDEIPISLFGDEIDVGYQAWSLISTGRDYMGHTLPVYIQSLTEWRAPLLMYVVAPFIGILGPSTISVRLPVALLGIANILLLYFLSKHLFKSGKLALITSFLLAISPWHIHFSRAAFEVTLLLTLLLSGTLIFVKGKHFISLIPFTLTFYTYSTANIFTPLLVLCLYLINRPQINLKSDWLKFFPGFLLCLPIAYFILAGPASGRFAGISIFSDQKAIDTIITTRTEPWVIGSKVEQFFHNKPLLYLGTFAKNYLTAFSPDFLFLNGDPNFRHSIGGGFGELPLFFAPFLLIGIFHLFETRDKKESRLILLWLFLSPLASSLTQGGGNHATRLFVMLPAVIIASAVGFVYVANLLSAKIKGYLLGIIFVAISLIFVVSYFHQYSSHYKYLSTKNWHYGYEQTFSGLSMETVGNHNLYINNTYEPSLLKFLFFSKYPPQKFQQEFTGDQTVTSLIPNFDGFRLGSNLYFGAIQTGVSLDDFLNSGDIYIASQRMEIPGDQDWSKETPHAFSIPSITYDVFGQPLFTVIKKK